LEFTVRLVRVTAAPVFRFTVEPVTTTLGVVRADPGLSVCVPPPNCNVPLPPKLPVCVPLPLRLRVPELTVAVPVLLRGTPTLAVKLPAATLKAPLLANRLVPLLFCIGDRPLAVTERLYAPRLLIVPLWKARAPVLPPATVWLSVPWLLSVRL